MAEDKKKKSPVDSTVFRKDFIVPMIELPKNQLKTMKITPRDQQGCVLVCTLCCRPLRSAHSANSHVHSKPHIVKVKEKQLEQMLSRLPPFLPSHQQQCLTEVMERVFREQSAQAQGQSEAREGIASQLQELLQHTFPDVTIELFGSSASGFAVITSNVNLNINIPGAQEKQVLISQVMKKTVEILSAKKELYADVNGDFFAFNKIPRILFQHKESGLLCELRALAGNPVALTSLLKVYGCIDERALKLGVLLRYWANLCRVDLQENGYYPAHMFVVMVIYFLQQRKPPLLPSLHELYSKTDGGKEETGGIESGNAERGRSQFEEKSDDGDMKQIKARGEEPGDTKKRVQQGDRRRMGGEKMSQYEPPSAQYLSDLSEVRRKWQCNNQENLGDLWYGLLRYYVLEFNIAEYAITIRQSQLLKRREREWGSVRLAIEDPLIPRSNLARAACSERVYNYLISTLKQTLLYFSRSTTNMGPIQPPQEECAPEDEDEKSGDSAHEKIKSLFELKMDGIEQQIKSQDQATESNVIEGSIAVTIATPIDIEESSPTCSHADSETLVDAKTSTTTFERLPDQSPNDGEEPSTQQKQRHGVTDEDNSIIFAAFKDYESPLPPRKPLDISFQSDSYLSEAEIKDQQSTLPSTPPHALVALEQKKLVSDIQFGSFELDSSVSKKGQHEEEKKSESQTPVEIPEDYTQQKLQSPQPTSNSPVSGQNEGKSISPPPEVVSLAFNEKAKNRTCVEKYEEVEYVFSANNFVLDLQEYPTACLNCKRVVNHIAKDCPDDELPAKRAPKSLPGRESLKNIKEIFKRYMKSVMPREQHLQMRQSICDCIQADVIKIFPTARIELFGSSANGFGSFQSDLDLCMMLGEEREEFSKSGVIEAVAAELEKHPEKYQFILSITTARVPIVKFWMVKRHLECDISLENRLALRNTKMLAAYASIDDRVKILGYAIKHLAKVCDMGDASTGSLSSYAYILLLLHYLQRTNPPVIPVLQQLFPDGVSSCVEPSIDSWNCYFYEFSDPQKELAKVWPDYKKNTQSIGELWLGFLRYFATEFDWNKNVVTIRQFQAMTKFDKWWLSKCMCIEDPFNLDHNLGASASTKMRLYILDRLLAALHFHSKDILWVDMRSMMNEEVLVGDDRSPKFLICLCCNKRGHRAQNCPYKNSGNRRPRASVKERIRSNHNPPKERSTLEPVKPASTSAGRGGILHIKSGGDLSVPTNAGRESRIRNEQGNRRRHASNPPMKPKSDRIHSPSRVHHVPPTGILLSSQYTPLLPSPEMGSSLGGAPPPPGFPMIRGHPSTRGGSGTRGSITFNQSGGRTMSGLLHGQSREPLLPSPSVAAYIPASPVHTTQYPSEQSPTVLTPEGYLLPAPIRPQYQPPIRPQYQPPMSSPSTFHPLQQMPSQATPTTLSVYPNDESYLHSRAQYYPAHSNIHSPAHQFYRHPDPYYQQSPYFDRHEQSHGYGHTDN